MGDELSPDELEELEEISSEEADAFAEHGAEPVHTLREAWRVWVLVRDCRDVDGTGGRHGLQWERVANVLREWYGGRIAPSPSLHKALRRICGMVIKLETDAREALREADAARRNAGG